jgi:hypothetical protein
MKDKLEIIVNSLHYGRGPSRKVALRGDHVLVSEIGEESAQKWVKAKLVKRIVSEGKAGKPVKEKVKVEVKTAEPVTDSLAEAENQDGF